MSKIVLPKRTELSEAIKSIYSENAGWRVDGRVASHETKHTRIEVLHTCFNDLWEIGYKIINPHNLRHEHIQALCEHWMKKGLAISTIQSRLSMLRILWRWLKKSGKVKSLYEYLPSIDKKLLRVRTVAMQSKSWTANDVDLAKKLKEAKRVDERFFLMLLLQICFGLRRAEVLQFKPHKSDLGNRIRVYEAKNGRQRDVDVETPWQRRVLDLVKTSIRGKLEYLGWRETARNKPADLDQNLTRYNGYMRRIGITRKDAGVTGHGLRAQYAENAALIAQVIPPTLGGVGGQMAKDELDLRRAQVSEKLGHSRISVTGAYYGSFGRNFSPVAANHTKHVIEEAVSQSTQMLTRVPLEREDDCFYLMRELQREGVYITLQQVHLLWEIHSARFAEKWVAPRAQNMAALEAAAITLMPKKAA